MTVINSDMASQVTDTAKNETAQGNINPPAKRLYTLKEAGEYLGRSEYSVRTLIWNGLLPVVRNGKKQWVDILDMDLFIERNRETIQ